MTRSGRQPLVQPGRVFGIAYWTTAIVVSVFVALTSGARGELRLVDAWEHHRVVRVLAQLGFGAGNPTYATDEPSIRYSPYSILLALASRWGHWDAWDVMTVAAVANTALLFVALYVILAAFGRTSIAFPTALVLLLLYGAAPGYANSLALEDLPVHQVNPSAFALVVSIFCWAAWRWASSSRTRMLWVGAAISPAIAAATLSHGMTGILGLIGLAGVSLASPRWKPMLAGTVIISAVAFTLCAAWPYYPFVRAVLHVPNPEYWYNPFILERMLESWCLPAMVAAALAVPHRDEPLVRFGLAGMIATILLTLLAAVTRSATLARLPLAGLLFSQLLVGYVIARWDLGSLSSWREIVSGLRSRSGDVFAGAFLRLTIPLAILFFGIPQLVDIAREPHLLRPYFASLVHRADKRTNLPAHYREVLAPVAERDVVMADPGTGWPVPSFSGRVVAAKHFEFFTPAQQHRVDDALSFMRPGTPALDRIRLLDTYGARWILLDRIANERVLPELLIPGAVVRESGGLVLMDAARWRSRVSPVSAAH